MNSASARWSQPQPALFRQQLEEFRPEAAAVSDAATASSDEYRALAAAFPQTHFFAVEEGILQLVRGGGDILLSAIVGAAGLLPTLEAIPTFGTIALANKETLVVAGDLVREKIRQHGTCLRPVDSEHSAVFSLLHGRDRAALRRIILTASGGSLRDYPVDALDAVTPAQALAHPTWDMGSKITIDSATLVNKGLEVIEAHHLFEISYDKISVLVHPESIIHSLIEMNNGEIFAQMGVTDMAFPILNALMYPEIRHNGFGFLDLAAKKSLTFREFEAGVTPPWSCVMQPAKRGAPCLRFSTQRTKLLWAHFLKTGFLFRTSCARLSGSCSSIGPSPGMILKNCWQQTIGPAIRPAH